MKYIFCCLPLLLLLACNNASGPTGPDNGPWYYFDFTGYGEDLSPGYFKVYSDSTWQKYAGIDTVLGTAYVAVLADDSTLSLYSTGANLYAGYQLNGQAPIIFDSPLPPLPTRWPSDTTYGRVATFTYNGIFVQITDYYTLVDTDSVATPVGNFSPAAHILDQTYLITSNGGSGYDAQDIWLGRGPGEIVYAGQGQAAVFFMYGYVNGTAWGGYGQGQVAVIRQNLTAVSRSSRVPAGSNRTLTGSNQIHAGSNSALLKAFAKGLLFFGTKKN